ncbi:hypothetical protein [Halobaculum marinum]|uniref:Uncharacterized protein n=1 Tax=Halobaculum marinum TaxID=3031996 RepID=A0ABD5WXW4_9EURY|nr:hypothetical protein [Halobaculum sp. DT55]
MRSRPPAGRRRAASRLLGVLGAASATVAAVGVVAPAPLADVFVTALVGGAAAVAVGGGVAAWTGRRLGVWVAALTVTAFSAVGLMTVGFLFVPAALCLLAAAALSGWAGPLVAASSTPPTPRRAALYAVAGAVAVGVGAWLVDVAAFERDLFGSCARETPACVAATTNWPAVAAAAAGLAACVVGAWLFGRGVVAAGRLVRASSGS